MAAARPRSSAEAAPWRQPPRRLTGDRGDAIVVLVVLQNGDPDCFGSRGDHEIRMLHRALRRAAPSAQLLIDPQPALPVRLVDRGVDQRFESSSRISAK